jgi:hypothetical protein
MARRGRRILIGTSIVLLLGIGGVATVPRLLWSDGVDYSAVASITTTHEYQDPQLLAKAWHLPVAAVYEHDGVDFQRNGSFCGPASAVNVIRSLGANADQKTVLDGTGLTTVFGLRLGGVTLDQLADVVRHKSGRKVTVLRDLDLAAFRAEMAKANDPSRRYIVNFHRGPLFAGGGGHHSPIGGYLPDEDLVLVVDVNARYKPWLVPTARLFAAVDTVDKVSGKKRGLLLIE